MNRYEGSRLARCARLLGLGRNPLRRRSDRIEAALRVVTLILLLVAMPMAAAVAGLQADHLVLRQVHAQHVADHQVTAVLLQQAQRTGIPDPYTSVQMTLVLARWQPPGGPPRSGQVQVPAGARAGSTVTVLIDASGAITRPPPDHRVIVGDVCVTAVVTGLIVSLLVLGSGRLCQRALDRHRMRAWDAEWQATGPRWTGNPR